MSEKRFVCIDVGYGDDWYITDNGKRLSEMEIVDLLNEQQELIEELQVSDEMGWKRAEKFEKECQKYNHLKTKHVSGLCLNAADPKLYKERSDFDEFVLEDFEFIKVPIPKTYDRVLRDKYGNYMEFVRDMNYHGGLILDADTPYTEWIKQHDELYQR